MLDLQLNKLYGSVRKFIAFSFSFCSAIFFYDKASNEKAKARKEFFGVHQAWR